MGSELVERLKRRGGYRFVEGVHPNQWFPDALCHEAAAALSAQEEELGRLRKALTAARKMIQTRETVDEIGWGKGSSPATRLLATIDAALEGSKRDG